MTVSPKSLLYLLVLVIAIGGSAFAGRATAPPPIFFQKAFILLVTMDSGEPRIMGIRATPEECKVQQQEEIRRLPALPEQSRFDSEKTVCQQVLLPTPQ